MQVDWTLTKFNKGQTSVLLVNVCRLPVEGVGVSFDGFTPKIFTAVWRMFKPILPVVSPPL